jgi:hypothetical protein
VQKFTSDVKDQSKTTVLFGYRILPFSYSAGYENIGTVKRSTGIQKRLGLILEDEFRAVTLGVILSDNQFFLNESGSIESLLQMDCLWLLSKYILRDS